jgi:hypothetical protein
MKTIPFKPISNDNPSSEAGMIGNVVQNVADKLKTDFKENNDGCYTFDNINDCLGEERICCGLKYYKS